MIGLDATLLAVIVLIGVALIFDYLNGFHDAANSIATVVATRVLTPLQAVAWAAFFNFVAAFGFELRVATTIGTGTIRPDIVDHTVIFSALIGAIVWNLITWYWGMPSSSSHALIGGLVGAGLAKAGPEVLVLSGLQRTALFIVLSPAIGMLLGLMLMLLVTWLAHRGPPPTLNLLFRRLQLISSAAYSFGHGTNDAQKTMGIIAVLLFSSGYLGTEFHVPTWVVLAAHAAIALGTLSGGWRIVRTMGTRITHLQPVGGFAAETAAAVTLFGASSVGIPVSTTHTISGSIIGVGALRRLSAVRWGVAGRMIWAWVLTIPAAALVAASTYRLSLAALAAWQVAGGR
jgi:PiT family inorganic phosphate transporter